MKKKLLDQLIVPEKSVSKAMKSKQSD